jgi:hypothetical protein
LVPVVVEVLSVQRVFCHTGAVQGQQLDAVHGDGRTRGKAAYKILGRPDSYGVGVQGSRRSRAAPGTWGATR